MGYVVVVMGVAGSGKTTVGTALARRLGVPYAEGDDFHPPANIDRMRAGRPLTDTDRLPWLRAIADWAGEQTQRRGGVVTCSALKRAYRDLLRAATERLWFLHLHGDRELLAARLAGRTGHFMPSALLDSQLADLEPLGPDEPGMTVSIARSPDEIVSVASEALGAWEISGRRRPSP